jgi:hypothetical protein
MKIKFVDDVEKGDFEKTFNEFIEKEDIDLRSVQYITRSNGVPCLLILYEEKIRLTEHKPGWSPPTIQLLADSRSLIPLVSAKRNGKRMDCMAGVMGVPPGWPLEGDDLPAPAPLISPDCDLTEWADLFRGIPGRELDGGVKKTVIPLRNNTQGR